jgi:hypothetical protein
LDKEISAATLIFDGDPVIGRALELLLRTAGHDARYVARNEAERATTLDGLQIVLLGPGWDADSREVAESIASARCAEVLPILEMGSPPDNLPSKPERFVPWPCRIADLKRRIDAALLVVPEKHDSTCCER